MADSIRLDSVVKRFGETRAVGSLSLEVRAGELYALLGPSGCGKTTTLRLMAGFESATSGTIHIGERLVNDVPVERRGIGMVFQSYALFPHLDVHENVAFGLRIRRTPETEVRRRVAEALGLVGLDGLGGRYPVQLSGGQRQRVALARALAVEPRVLLLDEPLSNLDLKLREQMRDEIRRLQQRLGITAVYVTHDQGEAMAVSDRIAVMNAGQVEQVGTPREIYESPATLFVASFIGQCNFLEGQVETDGGGARFRTVGGAVIELGGERASGTGTLVIRPETVTVHRTDPPPGSLPALVQDCVYLGDHTTVGMVLEAGAQRISASLPASRSRELPGPGHRVHVHVPAAECVVVPDRRGDGG
jgi:putative spermidine/putrescine transport system ATP-binding protein